MDIPESVGPYRLTGPMKELGWCQIGAARHQALELPVTLLRFQPDFPEPAVAELKRQLTSSATSSPVLLRVTDVFAEDGVSGVWLALEAGVVGTLADELPPAEPLPWPQLQSAATRILSGLVSYHGQGLVHGSVRPESIARLDDGSLKLCPYSLDDVCTAMYEQSDLEYTPQLPLQLQQRFLAREWVRGILEPSPAKDIYGVGVVLYELATGRPVYPTDASDLDTYRRIMTESIDLGPLRARAGELPGAFIEAVAAAIDGDPLARPVTAQPLLDALTDDGPPPPPSPDQVALAYGPPPGDNPIASAYGPPPWLDRDRRGSRVWLWLALAALALGGAGYAAWSQL